MEMNTTNWSLCTLEELICLFLIFSHALLVIWHQIRDSSTSWLFDKPRKVTFNYSWIISNGNEHYNLKALHTWGIKMPFSFFFSPHALLVIWRCSRDSFPFLQFDKPRKVTSNQHYPWHESYNLHALTMFPSCYSHK